MNIHCQIERIAPLIIAAWAVFLLFVLSTYISAEEPKPVVHVRPVVAHRGASFVAPENTLVSYRTAIEAGANGGECDVYRSADGVIFLSHDRSPKRTMGGSEGDLTQMTFEQIRQFDAGSWKGEKFKGETVPTLDEYLKLLKGTKCHPVIEIKQVGIEADVLEVIRKNEMTEVSTIIAFDANVIKTIRRLEPKICAAWLYSENLKDQGTAEENADRLAELIIRRCRELDIAVIDLGHGLLSPKLVQLLNEADIHVWAWTVNDATAMERYLDWGVVSITTDKPDILSKILKQRAPVDKSR
jgi:glycerophosphoryl diester phosphodiesterase